MDKSFPKFLETIRDKDPELVAKVSAFYESICTDVNPVQFVPEIGRCVNPPEENPYFDEKTTIQGDRGEISKNARHNRGGSRRLPPAGRISLGMPGNCRYN